MLRRFLKKVMVSDLAKSFQLLWSMSWLLPLKFVYSWRMLTWREAGNSSQEPLRLYDSFAPPAMIYLGRRRDEEDRRWALSSLKHNTARNLECRDSCISRKAKKRTSKAFYAADSSTHISCLAAKSNGAQPKSLHSALQYVMKRIGHGTAPA
jgi:hypothetical protein